MSPLLVGFVRVAIAAPCLWLAARGASAAATAGDRWRLVAAGLAMAGYQIGYFYGVAKTSVAVGALIAICSAPILMVGLAAALLGEPLTLATAVALGLAVTGAALLAAGPPGAGPLPPGFGVGMGFALGAGFCYALYAVLVRDVVARVPALPVAALTFTVAALALAPALALEPLPGGVWTWAWLAYLGIVPTALAYVLYVQGLRTTPVGVSGVLSLVEPLTATALGVAFFGDRLGVAGSVGAGLLVAAVGLLAARQRRAGATG